MTYFQKAQPVWQQGRENERHLRLIFTEQCPKCDKNAVLRVATSGIYQLTVNGEFVAYGPARAGKGHFRVDEIDLSSRLQREQNDVCIEVCGYNTNAYCIQNQPSFLQAEIVENGVAVLFTGRDFTLRKNPFYIQKAVRYSFQRPMVESYRITEEAKKRLSDAEKPTVVSSKPILLPRITPYPQYEKNAAEPIATADVTVNENATVHYDRAQTDIGEKLLGFTRDEVEVNPMEECQKIVFTPSDRPVSRFLPENGAQVYRLPCDMSGFVGFHVRCDRNIKLYFTFDELLSEGNTVRFMRFGDCANDIRFDLCPGEHEIRLFEPYVMLAMEFCVFGGGCEIFDVSLTEYQHPPVTLPFSVDDPELREIAEAGIRSFRANAVDIFTDCASRERAGWNSDAFFTGRAEFLLTGKNEVETAFLENFLHEDSYAFLPDGMLPMCYPADHYDGNFIPTWPMWQILQLAEHVRRTGNRDLAERYREKVNRLLRYFEKYENSDGLLEKLDGWVFVEWSRSNDLVQDVNYPSNMLYCEFLRQTAALYDREELAVKAENVKSAILKQSFRNGFFVDNAVRKNGITEIGNEATETCQYYAFAFGIATPETHPELAKILRNDFGPRRDAARVYPEIAPSAPFFGDFLRLELLKKWGFEAQMKDEIRSYFLYMARTTGTLWEHADTFASCLHGFASYVLCLMA